MTTQRIIHILRNGKPDETVTIKGWVRTKRELKEFAFLEINDGSSLANLQVVLEPNLPEYETNLKRLNTGASLEVSGTLVESPGKGQNVELKATSLTIYGEANPETYPLQKKRHSFEFLRTISHLRSLEGDQDLAEAFLKYIFKYVLEKCPEDMEFFNERIDNTVLDTAHNIINNEFARITYTEAIKLLEKTDQTFEFPVEWGVDLQSEHERYLAEKLFKKPVIVTNYPKEIKAFYMRLDEGEKTVSAMDILAPKIGEIIGGSQREERLDVLERRIEELNLNVEDIWWYLDLRRFGTVPHAGFGLGFERVVQFMTGMTNIRDVIPFPRTPLNVFNSLK
jgi:aspartyl/asparaginyl-tRNA synthetase